MKQTASSTHPQLNHVIVKPQKNNIFSSRSILMRMPHICSVWMLSTSKKITLKRTNFWYATHTHTRWTSTHLGQVKIPYLTKFNWKTKKSTKKNTHTKKNKKHILPMNSLTPLFYTFSQEPQTDQNWTLHTTFCTTNRKQNPKNPKSEVTHWVTNLHVWEQNRGFQKRRRTEPRRNRQNRRPRDRELRRRHQLVPSADGGAGSRSSVSARIGSIPTGSIRILMFRFRLAWTPSPELRPRVCFAGVHCGKRERESARACESESESGWVKTEDDRGRKGGAKGSFQIRDSGVCVFCVCLCLKVVCVREGDAVDL